jgi:serine/threonine protein kinase
VQPTTYKRYPRPDSLTDLVRGLPPDGVDLLTRMLQYDPARRTSAKDALEVRRSSTVDDAPLFPVPFTSYPFASCCSTRSSLTCLLPCAPEEYLELRAEDLEVEGPRRSNSKDGDG